MAIITIPQASLNKTSEAYNAQLRELVEYADIVGANHHLEGDTHNVVYEVRNTEMKVDYCKLVVSVGGDVHQYPVLFKITGSPTDTVPDKLYDHEYAAYDDEGNKTGVTRHTWESWAQHGAIFQSIDKKTMVIPCDANSAIHAPSMTQIVGTALDIISVQEWVALRETAERHDPDALDAMQPANDTPDSETV